MRLTGIDNGPLQAELYVFGPDRAEAPHFTVERCTHPVYPKLPLHHGIESVSYADFAPSPEPLQIAHPLLRKWVDGMPVATKLTATLSPADMRDDAWISWTPFSKKETILSSRQGACIYAVNCGAGVIAACLLTAFVFGAGGENRAKRMAAFVGAAVASGILLTVIIYFQLPKTEVRMVRGRPPGQTFSSLIVIEIISTEKTNLTDLRADIADGWWTNQMQNDLSGGLIREEDSPGNYQLRQVSNRVECVIYDARGAPSSEWSN